MGYRTKGQNEPTILRSYEFLVVDNNYVKEVNDLISSRRDSNIIAVFGQDVIEGMYIL
jgi:hypothetical protein